MGNILVVTRGEEGLGLGGKGGREVEYDKGQHRDPCDGTFMYLHCINVSIMIRYCTLVFWRCYY